jgi:hypothetical protein
MGEGTEFIIMLPGVREDRVTESEEIRSSGLRAALVTREPRSRRSKKKRRGA